MRRAAGPGPLPSARRMVGSIERVPGGARCPSPSAHGAGVSAIAAPPSPPLSPPPPPPAALLPPRLRLEAPLSFLRPRSRRCRCPGVGARGSRARGTQQVEPGVPGRTPPTRHAALCHLSRPQAKILSMMEDNKQLALRIDGAVQSASQEVTNLRAELTATNRRLAELSGGGGPGPGPGPGAAASASAAADSAAANMENHQHGAQGRDRPAPGRRRSERAGPGPGGDGRLGVPNTRGEIALHVVCNPFRPAVATAAPLLGVASCCH